ncbi:hypothetical protein GJW-30_1_04042 [Variibacter gotjawalensis]|uniref:Methyltransferase FkbM domain-containing protein n=1 Tax=Variibacter gotjawalensis TaxID=1333996 RepID=A0A0S3PZZ2_9BRAD|nr:hypothetical protein [Variibacter gotjawalensis]NIK47325.1 putative O-methyltransferase YrrM [Variibacter gotjawalensis]RZS49223.1 FkbM family methyltransferase [Variibacter gotjawalensis]BAT61485.1 hypothetical protein GJW-30_1_04042 [Variibacter gotjawalensis]
MRYSTWMTIENSPRAMGLYRRFRRLPPSLRTAVRWISMPRWEIATAVVHARAKDRVLSGPFKGMMLNLSALSRRNLLGYLLGSQEAELKDVVETIARRPYTRIINVGAADGYYAVGLLRRMPNTRVVAFEAIPEHHAGIERTAMLNGVWSRIALRGLCRQEDLSVELDSSAGVPLVVMDIEGGEMELLDPAKTQQLATSDILVETHDVFVPGCTEELERRFAATHSIERIVARQRTLTDFPRDMLPSLAAYAPGLAVEMMNERRVGTQSWLFMTARQ